MQKPLIALLLAIACNSAFASQEIAPAGYAAARQQFVAGANGDESSRDAALEAFTKLAAGQPGHPVYLAYIGSVTAMQGRDAMMPWDKMKYSEKGANMIEKALTQLAPEHDAQLLNGTPESIETRLVAVNTLLALPGFMNRRAGGKRALQAALDSKALEQAPAPVRANLFAIAARVAAEDKRGPEEIAYLRQAVATQANIPAVAKAAARLKELGQ